MSRSAGERNAAARGHYLRVRLLAPLTTRFSRKGDLVPARVLEPAKYEGSFLEGEIREVKPGPGAGKPSSMQFDFHALHTGGGQLAVTTVLVKIFNGQHQAEVDDEGNALESAARGIGGMLTAALSHASDSPLRLFSKAPNVSLLPGAEFVLEMRLHENH